MKKLIAAITSTLCPLIVVGIVGGYEAGLLPGWGLTVLGTLLIYAEWWGLSTLDAIDD